MADINAVYQEDQGGWPFVLVLKRRHVWPDGEDVLAHLSAAEAREFAKQLLEAAVEVEARGG